MKNLLCLNNSMVLTDSTFKNLVSSYEQTFKASFLT